ncbi:Tubulin beta chain [Acorus gramineus]|uniref:Tubulin beta chain n=1 Tax=Acorus gramineus TaxID=55184 RepID=A0AAV9BG68_ACOGR|nr:Tubulin beta chain [Acorus gramineus]
MSAWSSTTRPSTTFASGPSNSLNPTFKPPLSFPPVLYALGWIPLSTTKNISHKWHKNSDIHKLAVNLIPFPRLHFFMVGFTS